MRWKRTLSLCACMALALIAVTNAASALTISGDNLGVVPKAGVSDYPYIVYGAGFGSYADVWVTSPMSENYYVHVTHRSATEIRGTLTIPATASPGPYTVKVRNYVTSATVYRTNMFTKLGLAVTGVSPTSVNPGGRTGYMTVYGAGFVSGAQVRCVGPGGYTLQTWVIFVNSGLLSVYLAVPSAAPAGTYTVYVTNPGGEVASRTAAFTKVAEAAVITGDSLVLVPASGVSGITYIVYGTGFQSGAQVWVRSPSGTSYLADGETTIGTSSVRCTLSIPTAAVAGSYTVYVQNPGMAAVSRTGMFTKATGVVTPVVSSISPSSTARPLGGTNTITATVSGTGFRPGAQVRLVGGTTTIHATGETTGTSGTRISCALAVSSTAYLGSYTVSVQNPGSTTWVSRASAFRVTSAIVVPLTVVTGILPSSTARPTRGTKTIAATVSGAGFRPGAQVRLVGGTTTIDAQSETTLSANQIRCSLAIPSTAYAGYYTVSVQNPGAARASRAKAFRVYSISTTPR